MDEPFVGGVSDPVEGVVAGALAELTCACCGSMASAMVLRHRAATSAAHLVAGAQNGFMLSLIQAGHRSGRAAGWRGECGPPPCWACSTCCSAHLPGLRTVELSAVEVAVARRLQDHLSCEDGVAGMRCDRELMGLMGCWCVSTQPQDVAGSRGHGSLSVVESDHSTAAAITANARRWAVRWALAGTCSAAGHKPPYCACAGATIIALCVQ